MIYGLIVMSLHNPNSPVKRGLAHKTACECHLFLMMTFPFHVFFQLLPTSVYTAFPSSQPTQAKVLEGQQWEGDSLQRPTLPVGQTAGSLAMWLPLPSTLQPLPVHSKCSNFSSFLSTGYCVLGRLPRLIWLAFLINEWAGWVPGSLLKLLIH